MFTGIIEEIGIIASITKGTGGWSLKVAAPNFIRKGIKQGDSISIDGVCLTVTTVETDSFYLDASLETLRVTTLKDKQQGMKVNLERALSFDGRFDGHFVMGHVDGTGRIALIRREGDSLRLDVEIPPELSPYVVKKGSIAIDGISLTVNEQRGNIITVNIIPFTAFKTTIGEKRQGEKVNIEVDIIAKYIERFINERGAQKAIDLNLLYEYGFIKGE